MKQFLTQIINNRRIGADFFELWLRWDAPAPVPEPGQFLTIRISDDNVPLLRRPFAFAGYAEPSGAVSVIYQVRGRGTEILAARQPGENIDVIGPLGRPFPIRENQKKAVVIAGGVGLGPILFLADRLRSRDISTTLIFGCRSKSLIPDSVDFMNAKPVICTDDGTHGFKGNPIKYIAAKADIDNKTTIYGCGPVPMLRSLCKLNRPASAQIWISLEALMACGVGACMGCAVPTVSSGYSRACKEGPVFNGKEILWEQM
ncbi:MAG: dihydroorotate dehydrogenase electron transfer subunit [Chitinispirillales bacterium]|jgi:dihydroorotate dehydrogenase electron transfer subunit|nr:dihydroorotate dehydrogenase electron transfer subunit [Chitinispirillales bacterium]